MDSLPEEVILLEFRIDGRDLCMLLSNNLRLRIPASEYKLLRDATNAELQNFEVSPWGTGVHWPALDEDLSARGFFRTWMDAKGLKPWKVSNHLQDAESMAIYLDACRAEDPGDGSLIRAALADIASARKALDKGGNGSDQSRT